MNQKMPVVRQLYWPALVPQFLVIGGAAVGLHRAIPAWNWDIDIVVSAVAYVIACGIIRETFAHQHHMGVRAYRAQQFERARDHFQRSYAFFTGHPRIDWWRFVIFASVSRDPYRTLALCNGGFCESQIGNGAAAIASYEQALRVTPTCAMAFASLRMLRSTQPPEPPFEPAVSFA